MKNLHKLKILLAVSPLLAVSGVSAVEPLPPPLPVKWLSSDPGTHIDSKAGIKKWVPTGQARKGKVVYDRWPLIPCARTEPNPCPYTVGSDVSVSWEKFGEVTIGAEVAPIKDVLKITGSIKAGIKKTDTTLFKWLTVKTIPQGTNARAYLFVYGTPSQGDIEGVNIDQNERRRKCAICVKYEYKYLYSATGYTGTYARSYIVYENYPILGWSTI